MNTVNLVAKPTTRTVEEQKKISDYIYQLAQGQKSELPTMIKYWKYYNNEFDPKNFEYLTKIGENELPARLRHIPLQRHLLDLLISQQSERPFAFSVYAVDEDSVSNRYVDTVKSYINAIDTTLRQQTAQLSLQKEMLEQQYAQLEEMMQQQPQDAEHVAQIEEARAQLPMVKSQLRTIIEEFDKHIVLKQEEVEEIERYNTYDKKDIKEEFAQKIALKLRHELNINSKSTKNFRYQTVTGRQNYYVDYVDGHKFPIFESLSPEKVYFPKIDNVEWIQDGPWVAIVDYISYEQLEVAYGADIRKGYGDDKLKDLSYYSSGYNNSTFASTPDYGAILVTSGDTVYDTNDIGQSIKRCRIFYKINQRVRIKKTPHVHAKGKHFRHFVDEDKYLLDEDNYKYSNGYYVEKNGKESVKKDRAETYSKSKGEEITTKYYGHVYESVLIGDDIVIGIRKKKTKEVIRDQHDYTRTKLPVIGRTYNGIGEKPYSIIGSTMDLQDLYNIVHYHVELMLALAGAKGNVIDRSQKPSTMTNEEWEYNIKFGRLYIETVDPNGNRLKNSSFNQWPSFDNTLSSSVQYLEGIKTGLEETMGNMIGVPRPRQGQVVASDQVGTFSQSVNQASLITQILYYDHDEVEKHALNQLLNLACRNCFDMETILDIPVGSSGIEMINVPAKLFDQSLFDLMVLNNTKEETSLKEIKQLFLQQTAKNMAPFDQLISVYQTGSLKELEKKVEYFTKKSQKIQQMSQQQGVEAQKQMELEKIKFAKEYEVEIQKLKLGMDEMKLQLEKAKMDQKGTEIQTNAALKDKQINMDNETKRMGIATEREIELTYLQDQSGHQGKDEQLEAIRMQLEALMHERDIQVAENASKRDTITKNHKILSDVKNSKPRSKEKVKD